MPTQSRHSKGSSVGGQWAPDTSGRVPPTPQPAAEKAPPPPAVPFDHDHDGDIDYADVLEMYRLRSELSPGTAHSSINEVNDAITWTLPDGTLHREDGPALIAKNGTQKWFWHGVPHRADGPAVQTIHGSEEWRVNGVLHRDGGPAVSIAPEDGDGEGWHEEYYQNGVLHRKDGPALILSDGTQMWYKNGKQRRWFGPAVIRGDGSKEWCGVGKFLRVTAITFVVLQLFTSRL